MSIDDSAPAASTPGEPNATPHDGVDPMAVEPETPPGIPEGTPWVRLTDGAVLTFDEWSNELAGQYEKVRDMSMELAADFTAIWWKALQVDKPAGLDMARTAQLLAARVQRVNGPDADPLEQLMLGSISYMQGAAAEFQREADNIHDLRRLAEAARDETDQAPAGPESA